MWHSVKYAQGGAEVALQYNTTCILLYTILKIVQTDNHHGGYTVRTSYGHCHVHFDTSLMNWISVLLL